MKFLPFSIFFAALTIANTSVMAYETCYDYKKKNDFNGYNACVSRNDLEIKNEREKKEQLQEQKEREAIEQTRRREAERKEESFRERQLDLQRQQLEIQKQNLQKQRVEPPQKNPQKQRVEPPQKNPEEQNNDAAAFKLINDLVHEIQGPTNKLFQKNTTSGNCKDSAELFSIVIGLSGIEYISNAKITGIIPKQEEIAGNLLLIDGVMEFMNKCGKDKSKQNKN
jgi:hypothetical protein